MLITDCFYSPFSGILNITHDSHSTSHGQVDDILIHTKRVEMIQEKIKGVKNYFFKRENEIKRILESKKKRILHILVIFSTI